MNLIVNLKQAPVCLYTSIRWPNLEALPNLPLSISERVQIFFFQSNWSISKKKAPGTGRGEGTRANYPVRSVVGQYQALQTRRAG